jgi:hypothetical protein
VSIVGFGLVLWHVGYLCSAGLGYGVVLGMTMVAWFGLLLASTGAVALGAAIAHPVALVLVRILGAASALSFIGLTLSLTRAHEMCRSTTDASIVAADHLSVPWRLLGYTSATSYALACVLRVAQRRRLP